MPNMRYEALNCCPPLESLVLNTLRPQERVKASPKRLEIEVNFRHQVKQTFFYIKPAHADGAAMGLQLCGGRPQERVKASPKRLEIEVNFRHQVKQTFFYIKPAHADGAAMGLQLCGGSYEMKPVVQSTSYNAFVFIFLAQGVFAFMFFTYNKSTNDCTQGQLPAALIPSQKDPQLLVLLWTWPFGDHFSLNTCPQYGCTFTDNRSLYNSSDAVIIHHRDVCGSRNQLPQSPRPPGQYWVWFNLESPSHSSNLWLMDNLINLTMSYRSDSDIFTPYGYLQKNTIYDNFSIPEKSKLVAWAVSNWNPGSKRVQFYEQLKKYIQIDVYGRQHIPLPGDKLIETFSKYKFYLSFENSLHKDYITEKLWRNALSSGAVPIVLGSSRENYERFIPRDSFIHVDDFSNASQLANYLLELDKDSNRYQQFFNWRAKLKPKGDTGWADHYCKACESLKQAPSFRTKPTLVNWYT
ncbi:3-galactosyl-N-acetylglucosaminide 4-alpha-L-fucosyltransferase FUT3-like [Rhinophrynus dorsalis]